MPMVTAHNAHGDTILIKMESAKKSMTAATVGILVVATAQAASQAIPSLTENACDLPNILYFLFNFKDKVDENILFIYEKKLKKRMKSKNLETMIVRNIVSNILKIICQDTMIQEATF